jgi:hypothetical protein
MGFNPSERREDMSERKLRASQKRKAAMEARLATASGVIQKG